MVSKHFDRAASLENNPFPHMHRLSRYFARRSGFKVVSCIAYCTLFIHSAIKIIMFNLNLQGCYDELVHYIRDHAIIIGISSIAAVVVMVSNCFIAYGEISKKKNTYLTVKPVGGTGSRMDA